MMDDLKLTTQLWVFIFQDMETMGAQGEDLFDAVSLQNFNIGLRSRLEQVFVSDSPCWIPAASFLITQDPKPNFASLEDFNHGSSYLLIPSIITSTTSHPEEDLGIGHF